MAKKAKVWDGSAWQDLALNNPSLDGYARYTATQFGFRNKIINGDFRINKRAYVGFSAEL